jgi:hypothetical protein
VLTSELKELEVELDENTTLEPKALDVELVEKTTFELTPLGVSTTGGFNWGHIG